MPHWRKFSAHLLGGAIISLMLPVFVAGATETQPARIYLHKNWQIQSSCEVQATGEQISSAGFDAKGWQKADIPARGVGALVTDRPYPDPNVRTKSNVLPGTNTSDQNLY